MLSTQLTQKIIPVYASRSGSQFSPRCSITRNPILDCIHHGVFRRTSDGCAFLDKLLTTGREGNALGLCARQRLMIKDSEVCFSPRLSLSLCTSKNAANFIILLRAESHYGAQVTYFPIYTFHHAASISRYFKLYRFFVFCFFFKDQSCKIRVKEI